MHITFRPALARRSAQLAFAVSALVAGSAFAQDTSTVLPAPGIDTSGSFQQERDACMRGMTPQARNTCLTEARNAQADKSRNRLEDGSNFAANRERRCDVFKDASDRDACVARVRNAPASGTVSEGGMLLEASTAAAPGTPGAMPAERRAAPAPMADQAPATDAGEREMGRRPHRAHPRQQYRTVRPGHTEIYRRDKAAGPARTPGTDTATPTAPATR